MTLLWALADLRLAWRRIRSTPGSALFMLLTLGVSLGVAVASLAIFLDYARDPLPHKSDRIFAVRIDSGPTDSIWKADEPTRPPDHVSYTDARNLLTSANVGTFVAMYPGRGVLLSSDRGRQPTTVNVRFVTPDFFTMFSVPMRFGEAWPAAGDRGGRYTVITDELNAQLFGGRDSRGELVELDGERFEIVGVMAPWDQIPKYYDLGVHGAGAPDELFAPFGTGIELQKRTTGDYACWESRPAATFTQWVQSECVWIQLWLELRSAAERETAISNLNQYIAQQKLLGRHPKAPNTRLSDVKEWMAQNGAVPAHVVAVLTISIILFLFCIASATTMHMARLEATLREFGVQAALGAWKARLMRQAAIEFAAVMICASGLALLVAVPLGRSTSVLGIEQRVSDSQLGIAFASCVTMAVLLAVLFGNIIGWSRLRGRSIAELIRA